MSINIKSKPMLEPKKIGSVGIALAAVFLAVFLFSFGLRAEARQGCCSHHGGVCGCGCCDGTSLSATCAPYYPSCGAQSVPTPAPTPVSKPATTATPVVGPQKISSDDQIRNKINSVKNDYPKYHEGFRESLIKDIVGLVGNTADINRIGYFVYTILPDIKDAATGPETFTCDCSKTCPNISTCAEAQYQLNTCGCTARDADHDGIACDAQCQ